MGGGGGKKYSRVHKPYTSPLREEPKVKTGSLFNEDDDCAKINFTDILQNVNSQEISSIHIGEILRVILSNSNRGTTVTVVNNEGNICGYLISPEAIKLIECLQKKVQYGAKVLRILDRTITVQIFKRN